MNREFVIAILLVVAIAQIIIRHLTRDDILDFYDSVKESVFRWLTT